MIPENRLHRWLLRTGTILTSFFVSLSGWAGPPDATLDETHASVRAVMAVQRDVTPGLRSVSEVLGTAVGLDDSGAVALIVYVDQTGNGTAEVVRALPPQLRGVAVKVHLTDKFRAYRGKPGGGGGGVSHTAKQTPPIQLGTSGGWRKDLANGYCCGGTLGSLVEVNGVQYILSNYHVFESDIVLGGNNTIATTGSPVIQPGLIDVNCNATGSQNVGTLQITHSLPNNNVDVGLAQATSGAVRTDGSILEIGTISHTPVGAALNQTVKKSGRTTGLTHSYINGLNATISVTYENECAGGTAFTKTFTGQVVIK